MQRFEDFVDELSGLQSQMQNRRATVQASLRIPVSMHAGARQTFLEELGRGIKREINKLSEPQSYFANELRHLVTTDIVAIVDICDRAIAHPASQPELEYALVQLFKTSGLLQILPRQGEPFKIAEQDLIEVAQAVGRSMTVAQVIARGFYYKDYGNETLLRKAGVSVFR
jgi:molecular chaperone GrpE (heat shock protein)